MTSTQNEPRLPDDPERDAATDDDDEDDARTPFDNPWLLPVLLTAGTVWFGYDGWFNDDPDMKKYWWFNQPGAVLLGLGAIWTTIQALRERRQTPPGDGGSPPR